MSDSMMLSAFCRGGGVAMSEQLAFPFGRPARPAKREPLGLWACIEALRRAGHRVRRQGARNHLVDGRLVDTDQLRKLVRTLERNR